MRIVLIKQIREAHQNTERKTLSVIKQSLRNQTMEHLTKLYGQVTVGIHGHELPKFANQCKKTLYWKQHKGFNESPKYKSHRELQRAAKYWANSDQIYQSDVQESPPIPSVLKKDYFARNYKTSVVDKINHVNTIGSEEKEKVLTNKSHGSWATKEADFRKWRGAFDDDPYQRPSYVKDLKKPLYSSFTSDKIFPNANYSSVSPG